jgi:transposase InsO family protein
VDDEERRAIALWRVSVLGPLVSARLEHGEVRALSEQAAARTHQLPDGRYVRISWRTIETWYYAYKRGGFQALMPEARSDRGTSRAISPALESLIVRAKREKPRRSVRRIIRMLERAKVVARGELSRSTVHRLLARHGVSWRPDRAEAGERRSWISEHAGDLWVGDVMHGPFVIAPDRRLCKAYLISEIDSATRFVPHSVWKLSESAVAHEEALRETLQKYGRPRAYYVDNGSAYRAHSLALICAELGIDVAHTEARDAEAKGVIERWHRTWREEVGDELPDHPLPLAELQSKHWAWLATEYHRRRHETTGREPLEHWLAEVHELRPLPPHKNIAEVFLHRVRRHVRKDGTVRFGGRLLEVSPELVGKRVELRFDPHEAAPLPRVFVEDRFHCDTVPLDRIKNASRVRRRVRGQADPRIEPTGLDPLALMEAEHYERGRAPWDDDDDHDDIDHDEEDER